ncbi:MULTISPECIES: YicC/YloC family endoribonuclease [unclassified Colwellia]|uniref:YicC/YloC family endoribonuclease n=1 Tax=unclassified Colwellia TaxID=196834 RepID=UPI0015F6B79D|nr:MULTISPECIES: YicC/YloC family endoribonuclease [unclassified Colwellia]MBA6232176.1 YicC family protein [Colwellia sp. MB02u-7]MBA6237126.1 YicC family protein [Colwellia sp. MB02u-11]MBA6257442.1 YicC family protein [Colwellia sp. MB3u-28]MBA6260514.1 YicC family protein [Colwellia sp. MB3u-41]MBA6301610.1 YicC family protein [Colwellia sp. MB3u-22]
MIHSMTAFSRFEVKGDWGNAVWEIRSVNQRFLETYFRLPEQFRSIEPTLRERFRKQLNRGKVECSLRFSANPSAKNNLSLNKGLAEQLLQHASWINEQTLNSQLNPLEIMRWPGVMEAEEADMTIIQKEILVGFEQALKDFIDARASEGENLKVLIEQRLEGIVEQSEKVKAFMPEIIAWQRKRITDKFTDAKIELDSSRVEQELVLLAQKMDVDEEIDRLFSHVKETKSILKKGGAQGRRLDFMMQEFNREANTLGSKSINVDITNSAVELKVLIEQMREQIANIE